MSYYMMNKSNVNAILKIGKENADKVEAALESKDRYLFREFKKSTGFTTRGVSREELDDFEDFMMVAQEVWMWGAILELLDRRLSTMKKSWMYVDIYNGIVKELNRIVRKHRPKK